MRAGSAQAHRDAESSGFVTALLAGRVEPAGYARYLRSLRTIYETLEGHVRHRAGHPVVAAVWDPALERVDSLDADLGFWPDHDRPVPEVVRTYCSRLEHAAERPHLLVAHHYTRYLGDLAGGQVIGRALERAYGLGGRGLAFYEFPRIGAPVPYRRLYRSRVDQLVLSTRDRSQVVDEVAVAFELNRMLFDSLGDSGIELSAGR